LATTFYDKWFLKSKNWRIVRIAVLPELRQQRIGSLMLSHIQAIATKQHVDYLSTSFGFTSVLFSFWQSQHYKLIKIGARRDTSSGEHSSIWVLPISHRATWKIYSYAKVIINDMDFLINVILKEQSDENWWVNITDLIVDVENELALLGNDAQKTLEATSLSQMTKERLSQEALNTHQSRLTQFIQGRRSYANAAASIFYCFKQHEGNVSLLNEIQQKHHSKAQKLALIDKIKLKVKKNWHINS
jgi:tRNA(Met) cytidine acetyltransferase